MALSTGTLTFDLADLLGVDFDARRTKVWLTTNIPGDTLVDKAANKVRLGSGKVTVNSDGTGSAAAWLPGPDGNPTSWQTSVHVDYEDRHTRKHETRTFGPFTITASADLADLIVEQEVPPTYLTQVTAALDAAGASAVAGAQTARTEAESAQSGAVAARAGAEAARDDAQALVISDLGTSDGQMAAVASIPSSEFSGVLAPRQTRPALKSEVTKGLYVRTQPNPSGFSFRPMAKDPNHLGVNGTGRIWGVESQFAQLAYSDDDGATRVVKSSPLGASLSVQGIYFSNNFMWLLVASTANKSGELWRIPKPDANGMATGIGTGAAGNQWGTTLTAGSNGQSLPQATINIANGNYFNTGGGTVSVMTSTGPQAVTYTGKTAGTLTGCTGGTGTMSTGGKVSNAVRVFSLSGGVNGPGGATGDGGVNSTFRNACFAINPTETAAYLVEYGAANNAYQFPTITDGIMALGSGLLYSPSMLAAANMVGLSITVAGAGIAGGDLVATVIEVVAPGTASAFACLRLGSPARTAVTGATVTFPSTTYGAGNIPGGPSVYHCAAPTAAAGSVTWAKVKTFREAKHCHSVRIIGGLPWVGNGDLSRDFKDCGIWVATSLTAPTTWQQRSLSPTGGVPKDPINMIAATLDGQGVVLCESDSSFRDGPLLFADASGTVNRVLDRTCTIPQPYAQTMRQLTLDPATGNLYWFGTCEGGSVGPTSGIWMSRAPYTVPVLLEDVGLTLEAVTLGDGVYNNGYFWQGTQRCRAEKFTDQ